MLISMGKSASISEESARNSAASRSWSSKVQGWRGACTAVIARGPSLDRAMNSAQALGSSKPGEEASVKQVYICSLWIESDARTEGNLDVQRVHEFSCSFLFFNLGANVRSLKQTKPKHNKTSHTPHANPCTTSLKAQRKEVGGQSRGTQSSLWYCRSWLVKLWSLTFFYLWNQGGTS